jgi:hypothetical protein
LLGAGLLVVWLAGESWWCDVMAVWDLCSEFYLLARGMVLPVAYFKGHTVKRITPFRMKLPVEFTRFDHF